jgi:hypothetical protein
MQITISLALFRMAWQIAGGKIVFFHTDIEGKMKQIRGQKKGRGYFCEQIRVYRGKEPMGLLFHLVG